MLRIRRLSAFIPRLRLAALRGSSVARLPRTPRRRTAVRYRPRCAVGRAADPIDGEEQPLLRPEIGELPGTTVSDWCPAPGDARSTLVAGRWLVGVWPEDRVGLRLQRGRRFQPTAPAVHV